MSTENIAELHILLQQYISSFKLGKIKCQSLNDLFALLSRHEIEDKRTHVILNSALSDICSGKRIGFSALNEVYKYFKNVKRAKKNAKAPLRELCNESNRNSMRQNLYPKITENSKIHIKSNYCLRSSFKTFREYNCISRPNCDVIGNSLGFSESYVPTTVPNIHSHVKTAVQETSKLQFLGYFGLVTEENQFSSTLHQTKPSLSMSAFNNSSNVPFSSELGQLLAERVKHGVSEEFKLRKIERLERYINKPCVGKSLDINYPVTYVERNSVIVANKESPKAKTFGIKPLSVVVENVDIIKLHKEIERLRKKRMRNRKYRLKKKCRALSVVLTCKDMLNVQEFIRKKKNKCK